MGDLVKADHEVVRLVERIHVRVMSVPTDAIDEGWEQLIPKSRDTAVTP
jgi:hypothetical protein